VAQLAVDAVEERLDLEGSAGQEVLADDDLWAIWQRNDMDLWVPARTPRRPGARPSYVTVGRQTNRMTRR